jgi:hypothetical protein
MFKGLCIGLIAAFLYIGVQAITIPFGRKVDWTVTLVFAFGLFIGNLGFYWLVSP